MLIGLGLLAWWAFIGSWPWSTIVQKRREAAFWSWYATNAPAFEEALGKKDMEKAGRITGLINSELQKVHPGLVSTLGRDSQGTCELIISADGIKERFPAVISLVDAAPELPGWKITAFRPPWSFHKTSKMTYKGQTVGIADVYYQEIGRDGDVLRIILYVRGLEESNYEQRAGAAILLLDHSVGEYRVGMFLEIDSVKPLPKEFREGALLPIDKLVEHFSQHRGRQKQPAKKPD